MSLKVSHLTVRIENKILLNDISFELKKGEIVGLMGPNGSGKSSLALSLMGHPRYQITSGSIYLDKKNITKLPPDQRANLGLFLGFQYPSAIAGVNVRQLVTSANRPALAVKRQAQKQAKNLLLDPDLTNRSLNLDFSGGEKKKMEVLQMDLLKPKYAILDEIDSGLDLDALRLISDSVKKSSAGIMVITHYPRLLKLLSPHQVLILKFGKIIKSGSSDIISRLEKSGYTNI